MRRKTVTLVTLTATLAVLVVFVFLAVPRERVIPLRSGANVTAQSTVAGIPTARSATAGKGALSVHVSDTPAKTLYRLPPEGPGSACWIAEGVTAYLGVVAIPLGLPGAFFPPLGIGLGIAATLAGVAEWVYC